jgi:hypothetical protein
MTEYWNGLAHTPSSRQKHPTLRAVFPIRPENGLIIRLLTPAVKAGRQKVPVERAMRKRTFFSAGFHD